mgnify:CR=1 FL=1
MFSEAFAPWLPTLQDIEVRKTDPDVACIEMVHVHAMNDRNPHSCGKADPVPYRNEIACLCDDVDVGISLCSYSYIWPAEC